jgi:hypothetical protein
MKSWAFKNTINNPSGLFRATVFGLTGIFILFLLLSLQYDISFKQTPLKFHYELTYCAPGPEIVEINYRTNQLTFLDGLKNKRTFFSNLSPFDITYSLLDSFQNKIPANIDRLKSDLLTTYQISFLLLDLPPPSIKM